MKNKKGQLVSITTQLKLRAADGKVYNSDMLDYNGIIALGKTFPGTKANRFIEWLTFSDESIDGKSSLTSSFDGRFSSAFGGRTASSEGEVDTTIHLRIMITLSA